VDGAAARAVAVGVEAGREVARVIVGAEEVRARVIGAVVVARDPTPDPGREAGRDPVGVAATHVLAVPRHAAMGIALWSDAIGTAEIAVHDLFIVGGLHRPSCQGARPQPLPTAARPRRLCLAAHHHRRPAIDALAPGAAPVPAA